MFNCLLKQPWIFFEFFSILYKDWWDSIVQINVFDYHFWIFCWLVGVLAFRGLLFLVDMEIVISWLWCCFLFLEDILCLPTSLLWLKSLQRVDKLGWEEWSEVCSFYKVWEFCYEFLCFVIWICVLWIEIYLEISLLLFL